MTPKAFLPALIILTTCRLGFSQPGITFTQSTADSLRHEGNISAAVEEFKKLYANDPKNQGNIYNYACALSVTGQKDSAFKYLYLATERDTTNMALTDPDFIPLKEDKRWNVFESKLASMISIKYKFVYKDLVYAKTLWRMGALDQAYYSDIEIAEKKIGRNSTVVRALWDLKEMINNKNQRDLEVLIEQKGWPKISDVGGTASNMAFLIIQHSDLNKQKKYLPTIEKLCKEKEASWQSYALMYDRIQVGENKPQKYGSQVTYNEQTKAYELFPLEDDTKVEQWRKEIGMIPLTDYVARWSIKFEPLKR